MKGLSFQEELKIRKSASKLRKDIATETATGFLEEFDREKSLIQINNSMLSPILERDSFDHTLEKLSFSLFITQKAIKYILDSREFEPLIKISYANYIAEIGAREFISPFNPDEVSKNLTASKQCGYFFTPVSLCTKMVELSLKDLDQVPNSIIDPACGIGALLATALVQCPTLKIIRGVEIDSFTASIAEELLMSICKDLKINPEIKIINKDFLNYINDVEYDKSLDKSDILIMNPPYGRVRFLKTSLSDKITRSGLSNENGFELESKLRTNTINNATDLRKRFAPLGLGKGTPEYSKLFLATSTKVVREHGHIVAITPSSWLGDENGKGLRKYLIENHGITNIWNIKEAAKIFAGVNQPTTVVKLKVNSSVKEIEIQGPLSSVDEIGSKVQFLESIYIKKYSPEWYRIPQCGNERAKILSLLHNQAPLVSKKEIINLRGELDLTAHKDLLRDNAKYHRLIRGDHVQSFNLKSPEESEKQGFVEYEPFISRMGRSQKIDHINNWRIAVPQCSYMRKQKRIEACIIQPKMIVANSCNYLTIAGSDDLDDKLLILNAIVNSAVIEWRFRLFNSNNHVSNYEIDELPIFDFKDNNILVMELIKFLKNPIKNTSQIEAVISLIYNIDIESMSLILDDLNYDKEAIINYMKEYMNTHYEIQTDNEKFENHSIPTLSELDKQMISYVKQGGNWESIPESVPSKRLDQIREMSRVRGKVRTTYYGRLRPEQPSYTISTYFNRPGNGTNIHPWEDRTISCREAARLQSFPDNFVFYGKEGAVRNQIGNAVPPLLGYALGKAINAKTFVDLFAGAGGLSYGLELAGLKGIAALEIDKSAAETYIKNHSKETQVIIGDIKNTEIQNQLIEVVESKLKNQTIDLVVGGPPCQGFSTAGWRNSDDERNALVTYYLKVVEKLKPKFVLIENVVGLLTMDKGKVLKGIQEVLSELGYSFYSVPWVLNAEQYGVPQMRKRVVLVAARNGVELPRIPESHFDKCLGRREKDSNSLSERYPVTVAEALLGVPHLSSVNNDNYNTLDKVNDIYSQWCSGKLSIQEFLNLRGKLINKKVDEFENLRHKENRELQLAFSF